MTRERAEAGKKRWTLKHLCLGLFTLVALLAPLALALGDQVLRESFEKEAVWIKGTADTDFEEKAHRITEDTAHSGQRCEHIQLEARQGTFIHYYLDVGRAPVIDELNVSVWVKANRPGVQLLARLVLPHERNPKNPQEPLTALVLGDPYQLAGRWQRLELRRPTKLLKDQQQLLRVDLNRDVELGEAYVDRVVLNVYGGPGLTDVWIDDLEVGPLLEGTPFKATGRPKENAGEAAARRAAVVQLNRDQLLVSGKKFFFRGTRHTNAPLKVLRDAGFNTLWLDDSATPAMIEEAANLGFWVVPTLAAMIKERQLTSADALGRTVSHFIENDAVLFWDLGGGLQSEQVPALARTAQLVRSADTRPLAADVWDGFQPFSRNVDLLGVHRWPLMTSLELTQYRDWLNQRRQLAQPGTFFWTWVQTHTPEWYGQVAGEQAPGGDRLTSARAAGSIPAAPDLPAPQPEQIRLLTYTALAAGCRGLGFWTDQFTADVQGRDRLLQLAILNQELQMLEPLLVTAETPQWIDTSMPEVKAAVMRTDHGVLVLPIWVGPGSQLVPPQAAAVNLTITVPQVPNGVQAWEVSPAEVRSLRAERVVGGVKVILPEFGLTSAIVFTSDSGPSGMLVRFQDQARRLRKLAAQWSHDLAAVELEKVTRINTELEQAGHRLPDGAALLENARTRLTACARHFDNGDYREAYREAQRALRPLRVLMRAQWEAAVKELDTPMSSPYALSFATLPRHWQFVEQLKQAGPGRNLLPGGDFEAPPDETPYAWLAQPVSLDDVDLTARRVADGPHAGKQCLMLQIRPKNPQAAPAALERTFLAIHSPAVRLEPGSLVRISGWVRVPAPITASADGALFYDSAGGEPLAVRLNGPTAWRKFMVYRRVPASGTINVTVALTGLGTVYFDDLQIEPLLPGEGRALASAADGSLRSETPPADPKEKKKPEASKPATPPKKPLLPVSPTGRRSF